MAPLEVPVRPSAMCDGSQAGHDVADGAHAKLRLLILGWMVGTGSTGVFIKELAEYLSGRGHRVTCLSAGRCDWRVRPHLAVVQREPFEIIELRNPPVVPGARPEDPLEHVESPETAELLRQVLRLRNPQVVAIIDFPGWPASTVRVCREQGSRTLYYLQNLWPVCTRLSLYSRWKDVCYDFKDGARCVECMGNLLSGRAARLRNRIPSWLWKLTGLKSAVKRAYRALAHAPRAAGGSAGGGGYAKRREAYVRAINEADLLIGISRGSLVTAARFGVRTAGAREVPVRYLAQKQLRQARPARLRRPGDRQRALRIAYLGAVAPEKGAEVLVQAFKGIPESVARLDIYGNVSSEYRKVLQGMAGRLNPPVFHGRYERSSLPALLAEADLGIVPSTCEDTLPSTVVEFHALGIPVIGSRIGGIPEMIAHERNGLLFEAGNMQELRSALMRVIARPDIIEAWQGNLPSDFDPLPCWRELESACHELCVESSHGVSDD
jgi:glycosyltransferase involved in cell wall biosynthesis